MRAVASLAALVLATAAAAQTLEQRVAAIQQKREAQAAKSRMRVLQALLYRDLTVEFDGAPARDVFEYLATALDVRVVARCLDDPIGHGIDPELPITLSEESIPALVVLELVLEQCAVNEECTWQIRRGFLEVGTKDRLSVPAAREVRWYPVDELLFEAPRLEGAPSLRLEDAFPYYGTGYTGGFFGGGGGYGGSIRFSTSTPAPAREERAQSLITLITELVEPRAWLRNGGDWATIAHRDGALIIQAPPYIHRQVFGYPKVPPPAGRETSDDAAGAAGQGRRDAATDDRSSG